MVSTLGSSHDQDHVFLDKTHYSHNNVLPAQEYKWESVDETLGWQGRVWGEEKRAIQDGVEIFLVALGYGNHIQALVGS